MSRYWAREKFGEHERGARVAECNSSPLSADVISVLNKNIRHARTIEFDYGLIFKTYW